MIPVQLPDCGSPPELPSTIDWSRWSDLSAGIDDAACASLGRRVLGLELEPSVIATEAEAPMIGSPFREPVTGIRFVWVPGGRFQMGGTKYPDEQPVHWVRVSPFWLGETPVTNAQYATFLESTGAEEPAYWRDRRFSDPEQPVVGVSWPEARSFCAWLSERVAGTIRLPSEAQWEFAARGTDGREFPWGNEAPDASRACFDLDFQDGQPTRVGTHPAGKGPFGVLDQAGTVWEWCEDVWDEEAYKGRSAEEPVDPLVSTGDESRRVLRGGGWYVPAVYLWAAYRSRHHAAERFSFIGFRVLAAPASR